MPPDAGRAIDALVHAARSHHPDARWVPAEHRHLTLVFLGSVPAHEVESVASTVAAVGTRHAAIPIELVGCSGRPRRNEDGVAWLTVGRGQTEVAALSDDLQRALARWVRPTREGPPGGRPAGERAHVTVARRASSDLIRELSTVRADPPIAWIADRVVLFRSHLGRPGARYVPVSEVRLAGRD